MVSGLRGATVTTTCVFLTNPQSREKFCMTVPVFSERWVGGSPKEGWRVTKSSNLAGGRNGVVVFGLFD